MPSSARPVRRACAWAKRADASTMAQAPSVIWPQSCRRVPGSITGFASSSSVKLSSSKRQLRVCASGLRLALV